MSLAAIARNETHRAQLLRQVASEQQQQTQPQKLARLITAQPKDFVLCCVRECVERGNKDLLHHLPLLDPNSLITKACQTRQWDMLLYLLRRNRAECNESKIRLPTSLLHAPESIATARIVWPDLPLRLTDEGTTFIEEGLDAEQEWALPILTERPAEWMPTPAQLRRLDQRFAPWLTNLHQILEEAETILSAD